MSESETRSTTAKKRYHIGCQSWQYDEWITQIGGETIFYPSGTKPAEMLELYSGVFNTIEVDSTAYGTPAVSTLEGWISSTPNEFLFSLKTPRAITHEYSLGRVSFPVMDEFVQAVATMRDRLGVILIQFPAAFEATRENGVHLRNFISRLPRDVRFAVEFRHPSWFVGWTFEELNENGVALALVAGKWVAEEVMFAAFEKTNVPFAYVRLMGIRDLPSFDRVQRDRSDEISRWADRIRELRATDVFIYVDNYFEGHAPATANKMKRFLNVEVVDPSGLETQASLF
ncbi:MAG TPA: DUF72 domain-containing protein [Pyrinomonadaceae bacterium]|nr:DUF72 domain-containing protein [Pyrinomonadaceae bacterium]